METGLCNSKGHKKIATIHKRLIANINLGPCTKTKNKHYTIVIYIYEYVNMICINTGNSRNYLTIQESRVRRFKLFGKRMFE